MFPFSITTVERILGCDKILLLIIFPQHLQGVMDKPSKWHVVMAILGPPLGWSYYTTHFTDR